MLGTSDGVSPRRPSGMHFSPSPACWVLRSFSTVIPAGRGGLGSCPLLLLRSAKLPLKP
ncbi:33 kDa ribonucleoprotein [Musa troglodytarum]|uniref:33 kDa ribonucleoprotein n=1 Tax=Musa troglodytarum TaxID=320322 RepID=A0A9E7ETD4_9LILI|nr:33 kDa ribonucleoprotein [Musa troglodytarum]